jgi:transposase
MGKKHGNTKTKLEARGIRKALAQGKEFPELHPNAAGIDVGSREHFVGVPEDRDSRPVRRFGCYTSDHLSLVGWLKACRITTVVMESTGVYWVPLCEVLEEHGVEVFLVDARHVKNVSGRKSDVQDCQWIRRLYSYGLLAAAFRPKPEITPIRTLWRLRANLAQDCARQIQLMQKALEQMNVQLHKAVTDISGVTGFRIIRAIVAGSREPQELARLRDHGCKLSEAEFVDALNGNFRSEHVFCLKQAVDAFDFFQNQIQQCDQTLQTYVASLPSKSPQDDKPLVPKRSPKRRKNQPCFDLRTEQIRISGVDLTRIDGIDVLTAQTILSEIGVDLDRFPTEDNFASWLGLPPNNRKTGGIVRSTRTRKVAHRVATALRLSAQALHHSKSALAACYRRLAARIGPPKAITAIARKLACLVYRMLKYGQAYVDRGEAAYLAAFEQQRIRQLQRQARRFGFQLVNTQSGEVVS